MEALASSMMIGTTRPVEEGPLVAMWRAAAANVAPAPAPAPLMMTAGCADSPPLVMQQQHYQQQQQYQQHQHQQPSAAPAPRRTSMLTYQGSVMTGGGGAQPHAAALKAAPLLLTKQLGAAAAAAAAARRGPRMTFAAGDSGRLRLHQRRAPCVPSKKNAESAPVQRERELAAMQQRAAARQARALGAWRPHLRPTSEGEAAWPFNGARLNGAPLTQQGAALNGGSGIVGCSDAGTCSSGACAATRTVFDPIVSAVREVPGAPAARVRGTASEPLREPRASASGRAKGAAAPPPRGAGDGPIAVAAAPPAGSRRAEPPPRRNVITGDGIEAVQQRRLAAAAPAPQRAPMTTERGSSIGGTSLRRVPLPPRRGVLDPLLGTWTQPPADARAARTRDITPVGSSGGGGVGGGFSSGGGAGFR